MNKKRRYLFEVGVFFLSLIPFLCASLTYSLLTKSSFEKEVLNLGNEVFISIRDDNAIENEINKYNKSSVYHLSLFDKNDGITIFDSLGETKENILPFLIKNEGKNYYSKADNGQKYFYHLYLSAPNSIYIRFGKKVDFNVTFSLYFCIFGTLFIFFLDVSFVYFYAREKKKEFNLLQIQVKKLKELTDDEAILDYADSTEFYASSLRDARKQIEFLLNKAVMEASQNQYVLDSFSQGLVVVSKQNELLSLNKKALEIFSLDTDSYKNRNIRALEPASKTIKEITTVNKTRIKSNFYEQIGSRIYKIEVEPLNFTSNEKTTYCPSVASILIDVTEEYNTEKIKKDFVANASHELKSPITSILGYSQLVTQGVTSEEEQMFDVCSKIEKEAKRMNKIIYNLLRLSSLENENLRTVLSLNLKKGIEDIVSSLSSQIKNKKIEVDISIPEVMEVKMNEMDFLELFQNLIENAIKYNKENGKIKIKGDLKENTISISDTGIGIEKENLTRIFERFYRVDKARSKKDGGTGLGLSIAKYVAIYYGFELNVNSIFNQGTTFTVILKNSKDNHI